MASSCKCSHVYLPTLCCPVPCHSSSPSTFFFYVHAPFLPLCPLLMAPLSWCTCLFLTRHPTLSFHSDLLCVLIRAARTSPPLSPVRPPFRYLFALTCILPSDQSTEDAQSKFPSLAFAVCVNWESCFPRACLQNKHRDPFSPQESYKIPHALSFSPLWESRGNPKL